MPVLDMILMDKRHLPLEVSIEKYPTFIYLSIYLFIHLFIYLLFIIYLSIYSLFSTIS